MSIGIAKYLWEGDSHMKRRMRGNGDAVKLSDSNSVLDGLRDMLEASIGPHELVWMHVEARTALLIIEAAKRAQDKPQWFPRGKWATIHAMQTATWAILDDVFGCEHP